MTNVEQTKSEARDETSAPRAWEPMSLTRIGTFGDVLQGGTGKGGDALTKKV